MRGCRRLCSGSGWLIGCVWNQVFGSLLGEVMSTLWIKGRLAVVMRKLDRQTRSDSYNVDAYVGVERSRRLAPVNTI